MSGWDSAPEYGGGGHWPINAIIAGLAVAFIAALIVLGFREPASAQQNEAEIIGVASVIDGDTIEIHGRRIRLDGIDAPEGGRRCGDVNVGKSAALALSNVIYSQPVTCTASDRPDRYGRMVAHCAAGGHDIAARLVSQGWARDWPRYSGGEYAQAEAEARSSARGLWALRCPADLWGHRNYQR